MRQLGRLGIERNDWDTWLNGSIDQAMALVKLPELDLFTHGAADPAKQVVLAIKGEPKVEPPRD